MKNRAVKVVMVAVFVSFLGNSSSVFAADNVVGSPGNQSWQGGQQGKGEGRVPGVFGIVSAVTGTTITVSGKLGRQNGSSTTYMVDASNATIMKDRATSTVSSIVVGDTVMVQGAINGTSVAAIRIRDGNFQMGRHADQQGQNNLTGQGDKNGSTSVNSGDVSPQGFFGSLFQKVGDFFHKMFSFL